MTTAERTFTKKEGFETLLTIVSTADSTGKISKQDLIDFLNSEIEILNRKKEAANYSTKKVENQALKETILKALEGIGKPVTISELMENEMLKEYAEISSESGHVFFKKMTNQKLSALVSQLKKEGKVVRTEIGRKAYFKINIAEEEEEEKVNIAEEEETVLTALTEETEAEEEETEETEADIIVDNQ